MKKITKSFCSSFVVSLSAIFIADKLVMPTPTPAYTEVKLPQKNIALFIEKTNMRLPAQTTKKVAESNLQNIAKKREIIMIKQKELDDVLAAYQEAEDNIKIAEASQIPIEADETPVVADISVPESIVPESIISPPDKKVTEVSTNIPSETLAKNEVVQELIKPEKTEPLQKLEIADNDIIPIENGSGMISNSKIEIMENAPKNQVAMIGELDPVGENSALKALKEEKVEKTKEWNAMEDSPWVVAKANQSAKNNKAVEDFSSSKTEAEITNLLEPSKLEEGESVQTARVMKNILIPIPEDILNEENLEPQLVSSKKKTEKPKEAEDDVEDTSSKKKSFLKNIASIFGGGSNKDNNETGDSAVNSGKKLNYTKYKNKSVPKILPAEMKLSFQPNRAQISGQTLRWIQAFALKAAENPDVVLEIRIDKNSSYALQQRRLELLHTILGSKGIDENKINTVFTSREPNSFIIRTLRINDEVQNSSKNNKNRQPVYQTW